MTKKEREFLNDIKEAADEWTYHTRHYYENVYGERYFSVDVNFDEEEWEVCSEEMWNALNAVANEWDAGIDEDHCQVLLALKSHSRRN